MPDFIPGLALSEIYYQEAVRPILLRHYPRLPYAAALIGWGSDVLGLDTPVSTDHGWGPRMEIFLRPEDMHLHPEIYESLRQELPISIRGFSTHFHQPDPQDSGVRSRVEVEHGPIDPMIYFHTLESYWQEWLGVSPFAGLEPADWLTFGDQRLISLTAGKVFHDEVGLEDARQRLAYYPHDVWLYLLAAQWGLIGQEEAFPGRAAQAGDELGSRAITGRLVERFMRLCFLMERRYAPYSKWFGSAFQKLPCAAEITPLLQALLAADSYAARDPWFARIYIRLIEMHNARSITPPVEARTRTYAGWHMLRAGVQELSLDHPHNTRPFQVAFTERITIPLYAAIKDPAVLALLPYIGSVSQFMVESSDAVQNREFCTGLKALLSGHIGNLL